MYNMGHFDISSEWILSNLNGDSVESKSPLHRLKYEEFGCYGK